MKTTFNCRGLLLNLSVAVLILFTSCGPKDSDLQASVEAVASGSACSGVSASVKDGVVTMIGDCKTQADIAALETQIKAVKGVKSVVNNVKISDPEITTQQTSPVTISSNDSLMAGVRDAVKDYPTVQATVSDSIIFLSGEIKKADNRKLMMSLQSLKPKSVDNKKLIIK
jgi:osmotically-inducible protein OsmY